MTDRPPCKYCGKPVLFPGQPLLDVCDKCASVTSKHHAEELGRRTAQRIGEAVLDRFFEGGRQACIAEL